MKRALLFVLISTSLPVTALAQSYGPVVDDAPTDRATQGPRKASLELVALEGDGRATLQFQPGKGADLEKVYADGRILRMRDRQWNISFSAPLNKDGNTSLATLDGLASGYKFEFNFSQSGTKLQSPPDKRFKDMHAIAVTACEAQGGADCRNPDNRDDEFAREYLGSDIVDKGLSIHKGSWRYGGTGAIGYDKFNYRDPVTLIESSVNKVGVSGSGYFGYLFPNGLTSTTLRVEYQRAYEAAGRKILCPANPGNAVIQCFNDPAGAPVKDKSVLVSLDLRHYLGDTLGIPMAVSPLITYDVSDDIVGVDLPVYLVSDGKFGLTGGLKFGWRSDTKDGTIGIFVGKRFGQW